MFELPRCVVRIIGKYETNRTNVTRSVIEEFVRRIRHRILVVSIIKFNNRFVNVNVNSIIMRSK